MNEWMNQQFLFYSNPLKSFSPSSLMKWIANALMTKFNWNCIGLESTTLFTTVDKVYITSQSDLQVMNLQHNLIMMASLCEKCMGNYMFFKTKTIIILMLHSSSPSFPDISMCVRMYNCMSETHQLFWPSSCLVCSCIHVHFTNLVKKNLNCSYKSKRSVSHFRFLANHWNEWKNSPLM